MEKIRKIIIQHFSHVYKILSTIESQLISRIDISLNIRLSSSNVC